MLAPQWTVPLRVPAVASIAPCSSLPFSDSFTRANGPLGAPWTSPSSAITIVSNTAEPAAFASGNQLAYLSGCSGFTSSQYAKFVLVTNGVSGTFGAAVSVVDANNYYYVYCSIGAGNCNGFKYVAGVSTYLGSYTATVANGDTICVELDSGTTMKLKINSAYGGGSMSTSGVSLGVPGLFFYTQGSSPAQVNSFQAGNGTCP